MFYFLIIRFYYFFQKSFINEDLLTVLLIIMIFFLFFNVLIILYFFKIQKFKNSKYNSLFQLTFFFSENAIQDMSTGNIILEIEPDSNKNFKKGFELDTCCVYTEDEKKNIKFIIISLIILNILGIKEINPFILPFSSFDWNDDISDSDSDHDSDNDNNKNKKIPKSH